MTNANVPVLYIGDKNLSSWSLRPWLAMRHAEIEFEERLVRLNQADTAARLREVSPNGRVPVLHLVGERIAESIAICEWAAEAAPRARLWPASPIARAVARSVSAEMHSGFVSLRRAMPMNVRLRERREPTPEVRADIARVLELWRGCRDRFGADGPYLFGAFSIADCMFAPVCTRFRTYEVPLDDEAAAYSAAVFAHPAMREWCEAAERET